MMMNWLLVAFKTSMFIQKKWKCKIGRIIKQMKEDPITKERGTKSL